MSAKNGQVVLVKVGKRLRKVTVPEGYYRVLSGAIKPTDLFYSQKNREETGNHWAKVSQMFGDLGPDHLFGDATHYLCVIRKGVPVDAPCQKCHAKPVCEQGKLVELCEECYGKVSTKKGN
jgi:hypothetical protein